ncbi:MAG: type I secretion system permease/ATPase [Pseudomonadota bacterium]
MTGADAAGSRATQHPLAPVLSVCAWLCDHHGQPFSAAGTLAALPEGGNANDPGILARALSALGLTSRLAARDLRRIDPATLPVVLFKRGGGHLILTSFGAGRSATFIDLEQDGLERHVPLRMLRRMTDGQILLVTRAGAAASTRLSPETAAKTQSARHWFWSPVRANWGGWLQVLLAALCLNLLNLALPIFVMNVYDRVIPNLAFVTLWTLGIGVGIALALDLVLRMVRGGVLDRIGRRVDLKASSDLFAHAMAVRLLDRPGGAAGIAGHIRDFDVVREFFASATFVALIDLLFIGIFIAVLFTIVGPVAMVPLLAVPAVLVLAFMAQIPLGRAATQAQAMATKRHVVLVEALGGIETVKSVGAEPVMQREWENAVAASNRITGRTRAWSSLATNGTLLIQQSVSVFIILWGVYLVAAGQITIGGLIAANILAGRVLAPLSAISQTIFRAQYAFRSMRTLTDFMALPADRGTTVSSDAQVRAGAILVKNLRLRYAGVERPALDDVSLELEPGETVALVGRVGSGKSTLGKVLAGLLPVEEGQVLIDGIAVGQYDPAELRQGIGYLPQEADIFTGTLRENLSIGLPHASDDALMDALRVAGVDRLARDAPDGLGMFLGERGERLSGGQRQGVALARLLVRRPKCLFLDEPTNAMDQDMEARVTERLRAFAEDTGAGLILCTHRPSLAAIAQRMIVLDNGRKVLDGPREEVLSRLRDAAAVRQVAE